jgi:integrase
MAAKLEKTGTPGIYKRGSRYVIVWEHRGRQHKESFRTLALAREAKGRRQAGEKRPVERVAFPDYFEGWIKSYAGRTSRGFSETTRPEYKRSIEAHAIPAWRTWMLADVEPGDVRDLFGKMRRDGQTTSQIVKLRAALSTLFATAVDDGKIRSNPVSGVRIPPAPDEPPEDETHAKALTRGELRLFLAAVPDDWKLFFELLVHTGMRISEMIGLTWQHLELGGERPRLLVREQVYRGKRKRLKSKDGKRDIPLSPKMAERLLARRRDKYKGPDSPVFASTVGTTLIRGKVAERVLAPAAIAVGLFEVVEGADGKPRKKPTISFHTFRHTCASLLFDEGRNVKQVQEWLGHADPGFTLRTYVHLLDDGVGDAAFMDDVTGGKSVARTHPNQAEPAHEGERQKTAA